MSIVVAAPAVNIAITYLPIYRLAWKSGAEAPLLCQRCEAL
jgi:hypothetical protein